MEKSPKTPVGAGENEAAAKKRPGRMGNVRAAIAALGGLAAVGATSIGTPAQAMHEWPIASESGTPGRANEVIRNEETASKHRGVLRSILSSHGVSNKEMRRWDGLGSARDEACLNQAGIILLDKEWALQERLQVLRDSGEKNTSHLESVRDSVQDIDELFVAAEKLAATSGDNLAQSERLLRETYRRLRGLLERAQKSLSNQK